MDHRKISIWVASGVAVVAVGGIALSLLGHKPPKKKPVVPAFLQADNVPKPKDADNLYLTNPKVAKQKYEQFVQQYQATPDPVIQDQVGKSRVKLGYLAAHQKDWSEARQAFLEADQKTKGTGATGDFGTVNEEGAYQAIVCVEASGKKDEARKQYTDFIKSRPLSPLCMACYRRLVRLNGGKTTPALDALVETATKKQDANARFEAAVCGPKTLAYLFDQGLLKAGGQPHDYKALAKLCHTGDTGTTISGMIEALKAFHVQASAYKVNRQDLVKIKTPAILLMGNHYLTLLKVEDRSMRVYDTFTKAEREIKLPDFNDPDYFVNAILLNSTL